MMKLSEIKVGNWFVFEGNQELLMSTPGDALCRKDSNPQIRYKCVKLHKVSAECVMAGSSMRLQIRFAGSDKTRNNHPDINSPSVRLLADEEVKDLCILI